MTTDFEADLRHEFDATTPPDGLTYDPSSVLRQGNRTIRRHRIVAAGSAAMAVALVATGASLLTRPHVTAAPPRPAARTATTGVVQGSVAYLWGGQADVQFNRDPSVKNNVRFSVLGKDGKQLHELGLSSTGGPGQAPAAVWRSAMVEGHPITMGLVPSPAHNLEVTFTDGGPYGITAEELKGTGYVMFTVDYTLAEQLPASTTVSGPVINGPRPKEATRTSKIASISWSGPTGIVDGVAGDQRLTGRVLNVEKSVAVKVVLRPVDGGQTTVSGQVSVPLGGGGTTYLSLSVATTDPSGAAVVTGRQPLVGVSHAGPPIAAGILPPGSSGIGVITTDAGAHPLIVSKVLDDGTVIFALKVASAKASDLGKNSIKAVTWTSFDGTKGRINVTQKQS